MGVIKTVILSVVASVVAGLLAAECWEWLPRLTAWVIRNAARRLPTNIRDRYEEEWLAHVEQIPGRISRFLWALGVVRAALVMNRERRPHSAAAVRRRVVASVGLLGALVWLVDPEDVAELLLSADPMLIAAAFTVSVFNRALMSGGWYPLLRAQGLEVPLARTARVYLEAGVLSILPRVEHLFRGKDPPDRPFACAFARKLCQGEQCASTKVQTSIQAKFALEDAALGMLTTVVLLIHQRYT